MTCRLRVLSPTPWNLPARPTVEAWKFLSSWIMEMDAGRARNKTDTNLAASSVSLGAGCWSSRHPELVLLTSGEQFCSVVSFGRYQGLST